MKKTDVGVTNAILVEGEKYRLRGGGTFLCLRAFPDGDAVLQSVFSGYRLTARGVTLYGDGTIAWRCSEGGTFEPLPHEEAGEE